MRHNLKILTEPFEAVLSGDKRHEVRKNDRGFEEGDTLSLQEWSPEFGYSGRILIKEVLHITEGGSFGLPNDICVMSIGETCSETRNGH